MRVTLGIDIGQSADPTAIAIVEQEWREHPPDPVRKLPRKLLDHYNVRYLRTLGLNISYPRIAEVLADLVARVESRVYAGTLRLHAGELVPDDYPHLTVYVDATGVGKPVLDILRAAGVRVVGVYFTHGDRRVEAIDLATGDPQVTLGKAYMVSRLQALLQTRRLHVPRVPEAEVLTHELLNYQIKVDQNANDRYGAFKVGTHDDLVTALGLCVQDPVRVASVVTSSEGYTPDMPPEWAGGYVARGLDGRSLVDERLLPNPAVGLTRYLDEYRRYG